MSVYSYGSIWPFATPARAKTATLGTICCSAATVIPPRLRYWQTGAVSAGLPVSSARSSRKLVDVCLHLFRFTAEIDGLPHEHARHPRIRDGKTKLEGGAGGKAGDPQRAREPEALIDLRIDP